MKQIATFLLLLFCIPSQAQFLDSFGDGDFTTDPAWTGDTGEFKVNEDLILQLNAPVADTAFLATVSQCMDQTEWRVTVKLSFNTSSNNHARIYLVSDRSFLKGPVNGYFIQVGGGNDSVVFFRQEGLQLSAVFRCPDLYTGSSVNEFGLRILRDTTGRWEVFADTSGGQGWFSEGVFSEGMIGTASWFGVWCKHTSSNGTKFYFDDFYAGPVIYDSIPPRLKEISVTGPRSLRLEFSEVPDPLSTADTMNYTLLSSFRHPSAVCPDPSNAACMDIFFTSDFIPNSCDSLLITGVSDPAGNGIRDTSAVFCYYEAGPFDVLINEILADPDPAGGMPDAEFIELYNRSGHPVKLHKWTLQAGNTLKAFPDCTIFPDSYLIVSSDSSYLQYGTAILLFTSPYTLPNEASSLVLRDDRGRVIHSVGYESDWFGLSFKKEGGWSLEMVDPMDPCGCEGNWLPSVNEGGGTPGHVNSVRGLHPDTIPPELFRAAIITSTQVRVLFSEPLDSLSLRGQGKWKINDTLIADQDVNILQPDYRVTVITKNSGFQSGIAYEIDPPEEVTDCAGNHVSGGDFLQTVVPGIPGPGDLVINEILADPWPDASGFVELYNRSAKGFDMKDLMITACGANGDTTSSGGIRLTGSPFILLPFDYAVICEDCGEVIFRYNASYPERFLSMEDFPYLDREEGNLILSRAGDGAGIDKVHYTEEMQQPLLSSTEGVSLERINPDGSSEDPANWHSAASSAGFATPGDRNSQWWAPEGTGNQEVKLEPPVISPDNDGHDDILHILCQPGEPGYAASVFILDSRGRILRQVAGNELLGSEGAFTWDGMTSDQQRVPAGIYIVYMELVKPEGTVKRFRGTTVVAVKN